MLKFEKNDYTIEEVTLCGETSPVRRSATDLCRKNRL